MKDDNLQKIKLVVLDVDGTLTDGKIVMGQDGELAKNFHVLDGLAIAAALKVGLTVAIITGRTSHIVKHRAKELGIGLLYEGVKNKAIALEDLMQKCQLSADEIAFVGDDLNDLPAIERVGWAAAPANAVSEVIIRVQYVAKNSGGNGAVREIIEYILKAQNKWKKVVEIYLRGF